MTEHTTTISYKCGHVFGISVPAAAERFFEEDKHSDQMCPECKAAQDYDQAECAYCGRMVPDLDETPGVDDDDDWDVEATYHDSDCEWLVTRAHRALEGRA